MEIVNRADVKGGDAENVSAAKSWLRQIAAGELVVGKPIQENPPPAQEPAK